MNPDNKPFLMWFGYSRRERRSTFILLIILMIIIASRYALPGKQDDFQDISGSLTSADTGKQGAGIFEKSPTLFRFDPNSSSFDTLTALGLSEKQAGTILNYRNKGGKFRKPADIRKVYGIDDSIAASLIPYVSIASDSLIIEKKESASHWQERKYEKVELNNADSTKLDALPGIGRVLSSRIIKYRKLLGGFVSVEQLKEVYGLPESTFLRISDRVYADSLLIRYINLNDANFNILSRHPYLDKYDFQAILKYRELKGKITGTGELIKNKVLSEIKARKIAPYLKF